MECNIRPMHQKEVKSPRRRNQPTHAHHREENVAVAHGRRSACVQVDAGRVVLICIEHSQLGLVLIRTVHRPVGDVGSNDEPVDAAPGLLCSWHAEECRARFVLSAVEMGSSVIPTGCRYRVCVYVCVCVCVCVCAARLFIGSMRYSTLGV
jgi:hypothetical protein